MEPIHPEDPQKEITFFSYGKDKSPYQRKSKYDSSRFQHNVFIPESNM